MVIKISTMYTKTPGGRYILDGKYSAEEFRTRILEPIYALCTAENEKICIDLDGGYGYTPGFLEECFGGMVRLGYQAESLLNNISFVSVEEPKLIEDIECYIIEEGLRQGMILNRGGMKI